MITRSFSVSIPVEPDGLQFAGIVVSPGSLDRYDEWHKIGRVTRRRGVIDFTVSLLLLFIIILKSFPVRSKLHATTMAKQQRVYTVWRDPFVWKPEGSLFFFALRTNPFVDEGPKTITNDRRGPQWQRTETPLHPRTVWTPCTNKWHGKQRGREELLVVSVRVNPRLIKDFGNLTKCTGSRPLYNGTGGCMDLLPRQFCFSQKKKKFVFANAFTYNVQYVIRPFTPTNMFWRWKQKCQKYSDEKPIIVCELLIYEIRVLLAHSLKKQTTFLTVFK